MIALMSFEGRQVLAASRDRAVAGKPQSYLRINVHPHTFVESWLDCSAVTEWDEAQRTVTSLYAMENLYASREELVLSQAKAA